MGCLDLWPKGAGETCGLALFFWGVRLGAKKEQSVWWTALKMIIYKGLD